MTLNLRMVLEMESAAARAELETAARGIKGVTAATGELAGASKSSAAAANTDAAAKTRSAQASRTLQAANTSAAGATGNLVAQFQDIGVMMAAGQNPLQLAIQQGSQISQVIGQAGAAGAVQLLRGAFLSLLSPVNLITIGSIAAGAAMVQWLSSASDEADELQDHLEAVADASAKTQDEIAKLTFGVDEKYQVDLLRDQLQLRAEYNAKVAELNGYLATTTDSVDRQRIATATLRAEIAAIAEKYNGISAALIDQQNRSVQLAILEGIKEQRAGELAARQAEAAAEAERLHRAITTAHEMYARTRQQAIDLADAAARAGVEAEDLSHVDFGNLGAASTEALRLAGHLGISLDLAERLAAFGPQGIGGKDPSGASYGGRGRPPTKAELAEMRVAAQNGGYITPPDPRPGRSGGGASVARAEADALQELIQSLEDEIAALREQDPIQKEMLRHREALAGATEAERQKVEELIATREREQLLMEGAKARAEFFENVGLEALEALIVKGESFNDVLKNIAASLINAALQAAIFGQGPFGSLFGGKSILSGLIPGIGGKADGGMVHGPGTGTSDSILTALSNGEYVVNARATARNRHLLEAINAGGRVGGFAEGGFVGNEGRRAGRNGGRDLPGTVVIDVRGARGNREIEEMVRKGSAQMISLYDREGLAVSVQRVSRDPRRRG